LRDAQQPFPTFVHVQRCLLIFSDRDLAVLLRDMRAQRLRSVQTMLLLLLLVAGGLAATGQWLLDQDADFPATSIAVAVSGVSLLYGQLVW